MVRIFTDSAANLPEEQLQRYGIGVFPMQYSLEHGVLPEETFQGHVFYENMRQGATVMTSMANPQDALQQVEASLRKGEDALYLGISSGISGTCFGIATALEELKQQYPTRRICTFDTRGASLGEGLIVLRIAAMAQKDAHMDTLLTEAAGLRSRMRQLFMVDDPVYLYRGGRLSRGTAAVGSILQIRPILQGSAEGKIILQQRVRGKKKAIEHLAAQWKSLRTGDSEPVGIAHADCPRDAIHLQALLREAGCTAEILNVCYEPVTGSHVGPGALALFFPGESWR